MISSPISSILLLSENFPPSLGGTSRWFYNLYSRLTTCSTVVVTKKTEGVPPPNLYVRYIDWPLWKSWGLCSANNWRHYFKMAVDVFRIIRENSVHMVHAARCQPEGYIALMLKRLVGVPYLVYVHGEDIEIAWRCREYRCIVPIVLRSAQRLIANSRFTAELLTHKWKIPRVRIRVLYPGVDTNNFIPSLLVQNRHRDFVLLCPGRLQQRKGQDTLLRAVALLRTRVPTVKVVIAGDGPDRYLIRDLISRLELQERVMWIPQPSDEELLRLYAMADVVVLPNRAIDGDCEGFGIVLLEAQACGKPILCGTSGGTRETLVPQRTGYVVDCERPEALADVILTLYMARHSLPELGRVGRIWVSRMFDWSTLVPKASIILKNDRGNGIC